jgi:hypothetical protein
MVLIGAAVVLTGAAIVLILYSYTCGEVAVAARVGGC